MALAIRITMYNSIERLTFSNSDTKKVGGIVA